MGDNSYYWVILFIVLFLLLPITINTIRSYIEKKSGDESEDCKNIRKDIMQVLGDLNSVILNSAHSFDQKLAIWRNYHNSILTSISSYSGINSDISKKIKHLSFLFDRNELEDESDIINAYTKYNKSVVKVVRRLRRM
jgi:hypothetical protein